jgi:hypothetical protein
LVPATGPFREGVVPAALRIRANVLIHLITILHPPAVFLVPLEEEEEIQMTLVIQIQKVTAGTEDVDPYLSPNVRHKPLKILVRCPTYLVIT